MARKTTNSVRSRPAGGWRRLAVSLLTVVGLVSLTGFMVVHWTQRQLLTTENYVELVAPLPKNEEVASALSQYSVDRLFSKINVEQKVEDVLPTRAAFLAPPLTERLEARTHDVTKRLVQSDQFQAIWVGANRLAHQKLVDSARGEPGAQSQEQRSSFGLKLENLLQSIKEKLGQSYASLFENSKSADQSVNLGVDLKTRFKNFSKFVKSVDFLNSTLWLLALACLVGALAISRTRKRLFMVIMAVIAVVALLQLIGIKALRPALLNQIEESAFRPAVGVIYDELLATFQRSATTVLAVSLLLSGLVFILSRNFVAKNKRLQRWLADLKTTKIWQIIHNFRIFIGRFRWPIVGVGAFLVLIFMAFGPQFDWQGLIRGSLVILIFLGLVTIVGSTKSLKTGK